jgi:plasmid stabilization system protein ParE
VSLPVVVSDQASKDIVEHVQFLGRARPELGRRFLVAVKRTIEIIAEFPGGGSFFEL